MTLSKVLMDSTKSELFTEYSPEKAAEILNTWFMISAWSETKVSIQQSYSMTIASRSAKVVSCALTVVPTKGTVLMSDTRMYLSRANTLFGTQISVTLDCCGTGSWTGLMSWTWEAILNTSTKTLTKSWKWTECDRPNHKYLSYFYGIISGCVVIPWWNLLYYCSNYATNIIACLVLDTVTNKHILWDTE